MSKPKDRSRRLDQGATAALTAFAVFDLPADGDGKRVAPTEFRVFHAGTFTSTQGEWSFTARSAEAVMEHYRRRKVPLMGDYEHQTDSAAMGFGITIAPASITEMTPEIRADQAGQPELWVKDVKWTARAQGMLEAGEYRLFSPTFGFDKETREVTALLRIALTNDPSMDNLQPLVAASSAGAGADDETTEEEDNEMANEPGQGQAPTCQACAATKAHLADFKAQHDAMGEQHKDLLDKHNKLAADHAALSARLKSFMDWAAEEVAEHGDEAEMCGWRNASASEAPNVAAQLSTLGSISKRLKAQKALLAEVATLTGAKGHGEILGALTAWKGSNAELATLKSKVAAEETARLTAEYNQLATQAVADGKLPPATKAICDGYLKSHDVATAKAFLTSFIGTTTVRTVGNETAQPDPKHADAVASLTAGQREVATKLGTSMEVIAASKAEYERRMAAQLGR